MTVRAIASSIFHWWADTAWKSWLAHSIVACLFGGAGAAIGIVFGSPSGGWVVGITVAAGFYLFREIGDALRYAKEHQLTGRDKGGIPHYVDGIGDFLGPAALAVGTWVHHLLP